MTKNETKSTLTPDWAIHPGEILAETLELQGDAGLLATGLPLATIYGIIKGEEDITPDIAKHLENGTGVEASFWLNLQKNYDERN